MSTIQKFSIKKINKIRKILLLYIDKDIKFQKKIPKYKNSFSQKLNDCKNIYQRAISYPIKIEENFSFNFSEKANEQNQIILGNIFSFKSNNSFRLSNKNDILEEGFNSKEESNSKLFQREVKHINKYNKNNKNFIIIKDEKSRLKENKKGKNFLLNLSLNLKNFRKRKRCLSCIKIQLDENEKEQIKETVLEFKKEQKRKTMNLKNDRKGSIIVNAKKLNEVNNNINNINQVKKKIKKSLCVKK